MLIIHRLFYAKKNSKVVKQQSMIQVNGFQRAKHSTLNGCIRLIFEFCFQFWHEAFTGFSCVKYKFFIFINIIFVTVLLNSDDLRFLGN